ncbi:apoptosis-associated speck-like protein containing a CARD [Protopterus annectens]|uniref:apoptosis-associated speck-like protein containing a CARD n=1 Tax=Protopterus annectens TaxID=7888 RepID=UPI001CF978A2|nr:apoptosis-associated speck-like protein containing a CARD [Protopterus annectens]
MGKTVRDLLLDILEELTGAQLKRFKSKLNEVQLKPGCKNIPKGKLEKADTDDLTDMLIEYYTDGYAPEVVHTVLEEINMKNLALQLFESVGRPEPEGQAAASSSSEAQSTAVEQDEGIHFVDKYKAEIIQRVTVPDSILDILQSEGLLGDEAYDQIRSKFTNQEKMRELYVKSRGWGKSDKDKFYKALRKEQPFLVKDLGEK